MIIDNLFNRKPTVVEGSAANDYFTRRKSEEERIAGIRPPAKNKKNPADTDYSKRRAREKKVDQGVAEGLNEFAPDGFNGGADSNDLQLYLNVAKKLNMKKYKPSTAHNLIAKKMAELVDVVDDDKVDYARHMARKAQGLPSMLDQQGVAEGSEQKYLWHGSRQKIPMLEPRQSVDTGGAAGSNQNAIYATSDPKVAIAVGGLTTPDSDTAMFPNDPQMVLFSGKIRKGENVYLHKLPFYSPDGKPQFVQGAHDREFYSIPGVKGIKPTEIKAVPVDKYLNLIRKATPADLELRKKNMKEQGVAEGFSNDMSTEDMIAYIRQHHLRQHHDKNLHQDYLNHLTSTNSKFVLKNIPLTSIRTELSGLDRAKVEQYKQMDFSKAPPIVIGSDGNILDGYHRATVAKALGIPTIKAYVGVKGQQGVAEGSELRKKYMKKAIKEVVHPDIFDKHILNEPTEKVRMGDFEFKARPFRGRIRGYGNLNDIGLYITAYDRQNVIGHAQFVVKSDEKGDQWLESAWTEVDQDYDGRGVAAMMYAFAKSLGNDIKPSPDQSTYGKWMWKKWGKDAKHLVGEQGVAESDHQSSSKTGIYQTEVFGAKAYHSKCLEKGCDWESRRFDRIKQAQDAAKKHAQKHLKSNVTEDAASDLGTIPTTEFVKGIYSLAAEYGAEAPDPEQVKKMMVLAPNQEVDIQKTFQKIIATFQAQLPKITQMMSELDAIIKQADVQEGKSDLQEIQRTKGDEEGLSTKGQNWGKETLAKIKMLPGSQRFGYTAGDAGRAANFLTGADTIIELFDVKHPQDGLRKAGFLSLRSAPWFPIKNSYQVANVGLDNEYRGTGLGQNLYGIAMKLLGMTIVADDTQTPQARGSWLRLSQVPGVVINGYTSVFPEDWALRNNRNEIYDDSAKRLISSLLKAGGQEIGKNPHFVYVSFPVGANADQNELQALQKGMAIYSSRHPEDGGTQNGLYARWSGQVKEQGVTEGFDKEAEAYKSHLLKTAPKVMDFLAKAVKGWRPSEEEMLGAIDTGYIVMKHTGDVKQAGQAMMDELNTLHRMSQGQQGVEESNDDHIWGPQGRFAGDTHVDIGGVTMKMIQVGDIVKYFGQKAKVIAMSKDRKHARITIEKGMGGSTQNVSTSDLKQLGQGVSEGMEGQVVFSGSGANGGKYEIIQTSPTDFMIHVNGKQIDTYQSLQRAMSVLKNEVPGLKKSGTEEQQLSLQQLATISDEALDKAYGYGRSSPGNTFGWQANLKSAAYAKQMIDKGITDIEEISNAIHKGWNVTAKAFVQDPDQFDDTEKLKAAGKLEAKLQQRERLMNINYSQLPDDEQEKDRVVARALLQAINGRQDVEEVAPPGDKAERMVKHIKQGYAKDGKLTPREKGIAFATAWKAHKAGQVEEARMSAAQRLSMAWDKQRAKSDASLRRTPSSIPKSTPEPKKTDTEPKTVSESRARRRALMAQMLNNR